MSYDSDPDGFWQVEYDEWATYVKNNETNCLSTDKYQE
jgi:hypothetical protein